MPQIFKFSTPPSPELTKRAFRGRFTLAEKAAIYTAAETDVMIKVFLDDIQAAEFISVTDQDTIDGVNYLESQGLIAGGRGVEILAFA